MLRQAARVLAPGGALILSTPTWQYGQWSDPVYHVYEYNLHELLQQMQTVHLGGAYSDLIVIAQKKNSH